jgi:hypothetical protein
MRQTPGLATFPVVMAWSPEKRQCHGPDKQARERTRVLPHNKDVNRKEAAYDIGAA